MVKPTLPLPPKEAKLWRYIDFTKFVSLLDSKSLYFCRADLLGDPFEAAKGSAELESKYDEFYKEYLRNLIINPPEVPEEENNRLQRDELTPDRIEEMVRHSLQSLRDAGIWARRTAFINCWHESEHESEAMWRLYAGWKFFGVDSPGGLALISTFGHLVDCLKKYEGLYVGRVDYIDYGKRLVGINEAFWHKAKSFEHEREVRAIYHHYPAEETSGCALEVDVSHLVQEIRLSPGAPKWFETLIRDVSKKYGFAFNINRSALENKPFY